MSVSTCAGCPKESGEPCQIDTPLPFPSFNPSRGRKALQIHVLVMFFRIPDMGGRDPGSFLKLLQGIPAGRQDTESLLTRLPPRTGCYFRGFLTKLHFLEEERADPLRRSLSLFSRKIVLPKMGWAVEKIALCRWLLLSDSRVWLFMALPGIPPTLLSICKFFKENDSAELSTWEMVA